MGSITVISGVFLILLCLEPMVHGVSSKKGVCHHKTKFRCDDFANLEVSWWYSWGKNLDYFYDNFGCTSVIEEIEENFVSMFWGMYKLTNYSVYVPSTEAILGPNEPNHKKQSSLKPHLIAERWPSLDNASNGIPLVSASAAPCGSYCICSEIEWFDWFFGNCSVMYPGVGCRVDYLATHHYSCQASHTMNYLQNLYNRYNLPIWLTEFACPGTTNVTEVKQYMEAILPQLEAAPHVVKYSWFQARITDNSKYVKQACSLFHPDNSTLTELGLVYNNTV